MATQTAFFVDLNQALQPRASITWDLSTGVPTVQTVTASGSVITTAFGGGGGGGGTWGSITGTLSNQTDLQAALTGQTTDPQSGTAYTLAIGDAGQNVDMANAAANVVTVPTNAAVPFPIGTLITVTQAGAGATSIAAAGGVTFNVSSSRSLTISTQWETASLFKVATNTWRVYCN